MRINCDIETLHPLWMYMKDITLVMSYPVLYNTSLDWYQYFSPCRMRSLLSLFFLAFHHHNGLHTHEKTILLIPISCDTLISLLLQACRFILSCINHPKNELNLQQISLIAPFILLFLL